MKHKKENENFSGASQENEKTDNIAENECGGEENCDSEACTEETENQNIEETQHNSITEETTFKEKEADYQKKIAESNDKYLRLYSEFDNFRKRSLRERIELSKTASEDIIKDLLPILDDFDRAAATKNENGENIIDEGILLIISKLKKTLANKGLKEMTSIGEDFNTDFHEAITTIPAPTEEQKNKIIDEIEKGYSLNDKVIRFAKVVIGA